MGKHKKLKKKSAATVTELLRPVAGDGTFPTDHPHLAATGETDEISIRVGPGGHVSGMVAIKVYIPWETKKELEKVATEMGVSQNEVCRRMFTGYLDAWDLIHRSMP